VPSTIGSLVDWGAEDGNFWRLREVFNWFTHMTRAESATGSAAKASESTVTCSQAAALPPFPQ